LGLRVKGDENFLNNLSLRWRKQIAHNHVYRRNPRVVNSRCRGTDILPIPSQPHIFSPATNIQQCNSRQPGRARTGRWH
jgi:hypothetical protein